MSCYRAADNPWQREGIAAGRTQAEPPYVAVDDSDAAMSLRHAKMNAHVLDTGAIVCAATVSVNVLTGRAVQYQDQRCVGHRPGMITTITRTIASKSSTLIR
eukprot:scpid82464/ scgid9176/ 